MEVEYAFLADAAQTSSDGKLYVLGGGIDRIRAKKFPTAHPSMSLVLKLKLHPAECEREHTLEVELWDPDANLVGGKVSAKFKAKRQERGRPAFLQLVLNAVQTTFTRPGDFAFQIVIDGQHYRSVSLYLEELGSPNSNEKEE
jgi:Family of unknown function (DUF6941)